MMVSHIKVKASLRISEEEAELFNLKMLHESISD